MSTRTIHEALRIMRLGFDTDTQRHRLAMKAVRELEALEKEVRAAVERGTTRGSTALETVAKAPPAYFVVAVNQKGKAEDWWSVASEEEGRAQAKEQSACHGQRNWSLRVYRGDALIGLYSQGKERAQAHWARLKKAGEPQVSPSALNAKSYHVFIATETGVHKDSVVVGSEAEALNYHKTHGTTPALRGCVFKAYEMTMSGQRTLLATFKHGIRMKG